VTKRRTRLPIGTLLILAINLMIAFYTTIVDPDLVDRLAFDPASPQFLTAFASLFVHLNLFHLLGNMVFLAAVGASVELAAGAGRFVLVYFLSGLMGELAFATLGGRQGGPLIGASGCVAGCAAYYSAKYISLRVPVGPKMSLSVATITGVWIALQAIGALASLRQGSAISFWAHLGGFICGLLLTMIFQAPELGERELGHAVLEQMNQRGPAAVIHAAEAHLKEHPNDLEALHKIFQAAHTMGDEALETATLLKMIPLSDDASCAALLLRLYELKQMERLSILERARYADRMEQTDARACEALLMSIVAEPENEPRRPEAMLSLVGLKWESNHEQAKRILDQLVRSYPLHNAVDMARRRGWLG
jgi:membrane associated rhomboid family serine protease